MEEPIAQESPSFSRTQRVFYTLVIIALPIASFALSDLLAPDWQNGQITAYVSLLLGNKTAFYFYPLLAYALISYLLWLWIPEWAGRQWALHLGILGGAILAVHFLILLAISALYTLLCDLGWGILLSLARWGHPWLVQRIGKRRTVQVWIGLGIIGTFLLNWTWTGFRIDGMFFVELLVILQSTLVTVLVAILGAGPFLCLLLALQALWSLWRQDGARPFKQAGFLAGGLGWLIAYAAAWRFSLVKMMEIYSALPKDPPNCYIATAAAQGHPAFVKSRPLRTPGGTLHVNPQLQSLKCAELALLALAPRLHRVLRAVYDVVGRRLARKIVHPLLADLVYLSLKPAEWITRITLALFIRDFDRLVSQIYGPCQRM